MHGIAMALVKKMTQDRGARISGSPHDFAFAGAGHLVGQLSRDAGQLEVTFNIKE